MCSCTTGATEICVYQGVRAWGTGLGLRAWGNAAREGLRDMFEFLGPKDYRHNFEQPLTLTSSK